MLAAGAEAGAGHRADRDRHLRLAARHEAQLGRMVDDHVHRHRREVHQHDLGHRPHADHRRADGRADDGLLGDRRGAHARRAVLGRQALGDAHDAAFLLVGDVLAEQDHVRVQRHRFVQRHVDGLDGVDLLLRAAFMPPSPRQTRRGAAPPRRAAGCRARTPPPRRSRVDRGFQRGQLAVRHAAFDQPRAEARHRVARHRGLLLARCHVGVGIAEHVALEAERHGFDQRRAVAGARADDRGARRLVHRERVVAVDRDAGHLVGRRRGRRCAWPTVAMS